MAEVLITLAIIGVVAAMTLPTLIADYKKQQTVTHLKKVYSVLNQALAASQADNGDYSTWTQALEEGMTTGEYCEQYWFPYIKVAKKCALSSDCGYTSDMRLKSGYDYYWKRLDGVVAATSVNTGCLFKLTDGTLISLRTQGGVTPTPQESIYVDLNGAKAPNTLSKDVFVFTRTETKGVMPQGYDQITDMDCVSGDIAGNWCAAKIMRDGWEIKDNYPW